MANSLAQSFSTLNYDVLYTMMEIAAPIYPTVVSKMMQTCHTLYRAGSKHLLNSDILLDKLPQLDSYILFVQAEGGLRHPLVKSLAIDCRLFKPSPEPGALHPLISFSELLRKLPSVERLRIYHLHDIYACLISALTYTTTLKRLTLSWAGSSGLAAFLARLQSPLVSLEVSRSDTRRFGSLQLPLSALSPHSKTLRTLTMSCELTAAMDGSIPRFPRLHTLELHTTPAANMLAIAFPNLRRINIRLPPRPWSLEPPWSQIKDTNQSPGAVWSSLEAVNGPIDDVHRYNLPCHVRKLVLEIPGVHRLCLLPTLLALHTPQKVSLTFLYGDLTNTRRVLPVFKQSAGWESVAELEIELRPVLERVSQLDDYLVRCLAHFRGLR